MRTSWFRFSVAAIATAFCSIALPLAAAGQVRATHAPGPTIFHATLAESNQATPEISTEELLAALNRADVVLLDVRPYLEWAISHLPGALNVAPKPGMAMSEYTSDVGEIERLVGGSRTKTLILYCNGPFCGKSKRVSDDLLAAGYGNVRRYQLGAPVWRALGGVMVIEPVGVLHVLEKDQTAVVIDAREPESFRKGSLPGARNLPRSRVLPGKDVGEVKAAKDDGRLPMEDHNTRIIVVGGSTAEAREVAEALTREAFHNVSFFEGSLEQLQQALAGLRMAR